MTNDPGRGFNLVGRAGIVMKKCWIANLTQSSTKDVDKWNPSNYPEWSGVPSWMHIEILFNFFHSPRQKSCNDIQSRWNKTLQVQLNLRYTFTNNIWTKTKSSLHLSLLKPRQNQQTHISQRLQSCPSTPRQPTRSLKPERRKPGWLPTYSAERWRRQKRRCEPRKRY